MCVYVMFFFFFTRKTAYDVRISDWSSDVCSSDLHLRHQVVTAALGHQPRHRAAGVTEVAEVAGTGRTGRHAGRHPVDLLQILVVDAVDAQRALLHHAVGMVVFPRSVGAGPGAPLAADAADRKSTRLNPSH